MINKAAMTRKTTENEIEGNKSKNIGIKILYGRNLKHEEKAKYSYVWALIQIES
jgi:hypothetical protein